MQKENIVNSSILDILFEGRNKAYGAYVLRRDYNLRLSKAVMVMIFTLGLLVIFEKTFNKENRLTFYPVVSDSVQLENIKFPKTITPPEVHRQSHSAHRNYDHPPQLVEVIPTLIKNNLNFPDTNRTGADVSLNSKGPDLSSLGRSLTTIVDSKIENKPLQINKHELIANPDIMPQYPGGVNQLLLFLKKNLRSPKELEEEIQVKVKFIVSYDGSLNGFEVMQSGGTEFDNEVLRVLKRMPGWIPGRSNGENVSVSFIVPVKFTAIDQ